MHGEPRKQELLAIGCSGPSVDYTCNRWLAAPQRLYLAYPSLPVRCLRRRPPQQRFAAPEPNDTDPLRVAPDTRSALVERVLGEHFAGWQLSQKVGELTEHQASVTK